MSRVSDRVVKEARRWIGTPYRHQASTLGAGADCLGLVRGVWRGLFGTEPEVIPAYSPDWSEARGEEVLWRAAMCHLIADDRATAGQVILFRMRDNAVAKHLGISAQSGTGETFIHAYSGHGVCESAFTGPWARLVVARFSFPEGI